MGDSSAKDFSRRYARPGEFEIPNSVLESNSFKERLGGELNSDRRSPAPLGPERSEEHTSELQSQSNLVCRLLLEKKKKKKKKNNKNKHINKNHDQTTH